MKADEIKALSDSDLAEVCRWADSETQARAERRKQETIAKIRELAGSIDMPIKLGTRGRPPKQKTQKKA
jgi:hypothetical protein